MEQPHPQLEFVLGRFGRAAALARMPGPPVLAGEVLCGLGELERQLLTVQVGKEFKRHAGLELSLEHGNGGLQLAGEQGHLLRIDWDVLGNPDSTNPSEDPLPAQANGNRARRLRRIIRRVLESRRRDREN